VTGFSPSASVFPCQYYSANVPYPSLSVYYYNQKDKQAKPGNLMKTSLVWAASQHVDRRVLCLSDFKSSVVLAPYRPVVTVCTAWFNIRWYVRRSFV
jgi:hypothetical protein